MQGKNAGSKRWGKSEKVNNIQKFSFIKQWAKDRSIQMYAELNLNLQVFVWLVGFSLIMVVVCCINADVPFKAINLWHQSIGLRKASNYGFNLVT